MKHIEIDLDVNKAIENGRATFDESHNDILRRLLGIDPRSTPGPSIPRVRPPRTSGAYSTVIDGHPIEANSLKELLRRAILLCEKLHPGFVAELSLQHTQKGRRIIATSPDALYPRSPQLVEFAERLTDGWWYDGNVGKNQVGSYFRMFAALAKLPSIPTISKRSERSTLTLDDLGLS